MTTTNNIEITVTTRVTRPRPTGTDVNLGVDYDAELSVTDEAGVTSMWTGELTYAPGHDGNLEPYGNGLDHWMTHGIIKALETPWIAAHERLVDAIVESLGGGEGVETIQVSL